MARQLSRRPASLAHLSLVLPLIVLLPLIASAQPANPTFTPTAAATTTTATEQTATPADGLTADQVRAREQKRYDTLVASYWYYFLVSLMFMAVLLPFVLVISLATRESRRTSNRPLGLPVGSFRSILAYSLVAFVGFYVLTSVLSAAPFMPPDFLLGIVASVIGFYFGSRDKEDTTTADQTATVRGIVRQGTDPARGAVVEFTRTADGVKQYSRITDLNGRFELRGAAPAKYTMAATLTGAKPSDPQTLVLTPGSDHEIAFVITSADGAIPPVAPPATHQGTP